MSTRSSPLDVSPESSSPFDSTSPVASSSSSSSSTLVELPRPFNGLAHAPLPRAGSVGFPAAIDPLRAQQYSRSMHKLRTQRSFTGKAVQLAGYFFIGGMAYHMILVHDWGDDTFGAVARRKRLQRISLHRPLSSSEQAILDRPWPTGAPEFVNFWDMWTDAMASHRARAAEREERKRLWEARHAADAGLSAESSSAAGRGAGAAASSSSSARRGGGVSEELPDVDWAKVVVQDGKQGDHP